MNESYPPVNKHSNGKSPSWIGNTSSNGGFSIAMLDYPKCNPMVFNLYQKIHTEKLLILASEKRSTVNHSVPGTDSTGLSPIEAGFYKKGREKLQGSWFKGKAQPVTTGKITDPPPRENFVQQPRPSHQGSVSDWRTSPSVLPLFSPYLEQIRVCEVHVSPVETLTKVKRFQKKNTILGVMLYNPPPKKKWHPSQILLNSWCFSRGGHRYITTKSRANSGFAAMSLFRIPKLFFF